jgi:hypothetical protein
MIPILLPALERHGRLKLDEADRERVLAISAATIDRKLGPTNGRRCRMGFYSAIRREVPIRTFNDWKEPPPGFCEVDMVAQGHIGHGLVHPDPDDDNPIQHSIGGVCVSTVSIASP